MAKSKIHSRKATACLSFSRTMALRLSAKRAVHVWRFPNGFARPECANKTCCRLRRRPPGVAQCNHCRHQMSLTGNTIFANTKLPLTKWFLAMHLLSQTKNRLVGDGAKAPVGRQI